MVDQLRLPARGKIFLPRRNGTSYVMRRWSRRRGFYDTADENRTADLIYTVAEIARFLGIRDRQARHLIDPE
jgi:hypothetical protein